MSGEDSPVTKRMKEQAAEDARIAPQVPFVPPKAPVPKPGQTVPKPAAVVPGPATEAKSKAPGLVNREEWNFLDEMVNG